MSGCECGLRKQLRRVDGSRTFACEVDSATGWDMEDLTFMCWPYLSLLCVVLCQDVLGRLLL